MLAELESERVAAGELVIREGDPPGPMYIVEEGRLRVFVEEDGERRYIALPAARRLLRRAVALQARAALGDRRGGRAVPAAPPHRGDLHPPADGLPGVPHPARGAHRPVRLPDGGARAARLRRGDRCRPSCACRRRSARARSRPAPTSPRPRSRGRAPSPTAEGRFVKKRAPAHPALPARAPDRRDGLRRRLPGHGVPPLRPRGQPRAHPPALHTASTARACAGICRAATELGLAARAVRRRSAT